MRSLDVLFAESRDGQSHRFHLCSCDSERRNPSDNGKGDGRKLWALEVILCDCQLCTKHRARHILDGRPCKAATIVPTPQYRVRAPRAQHCPKPLTSHRNPCRVTKSSRCDPHAPTSCHHSSKPSSPPALASSWSHTPSPCTPADAFCFVCCVRVRT